MGVVQKASCGIFCELTTGWLRGPSAKVQKGVRERNLYFLTCGEMHIFTILLLRSMIGFYFKYAPVKARDGVREGI